MDNFDFSYNLAMYLNCLFEIFLLYIFIENFSTVYEESRYIRILKGGICATVLFAINCFENSLVNLVIVPFILLIFVSLEFHMDLRLKILYILFYFMIFAITEFGFHYIYRAFDIDTSTVEFRRILVLVTEKLFEFAVIQAIRKYHSQSPQNGKGLKFGSMLITPVSAIILLDGYLIADNYAYGFALIYLGSLLLLISVIINFTTVEKLLIAENAAKDNAMLKLKTELEQNHYRRMEEVNREYAEYIHEMKHIVRTIKYFAEREDKGEFKKLSEDAAKLLGRQRPWEKEIYIYDPIINAILIEREKRAQEVGVRYEVDIQPGLSLGFMDETDKIRILGNLLDNALEASAGCPDGYVSVSLYQGNAYMVTLRIINSFQHENKRKGNRLLTTKLNKRRHGFGLKNVEELAQKYNGVLNITEENDTFTVVMLLSTVQNSDKKRQNSDIA